MIVGSEEKYKAAKESLERMQNFDAKKLLLKTESSSVFYDDAAEPGRRLIDLYSMISVTILEDFPDDILDLIKQQVDGNYDIFNQILEFRPGERATDARTELVGKVKNAYKPALDFLTPYMACSIYQFTDLQKWKKILATLESYKNDAEKILKEMRKAAGDVGDIKQAEHFKAEFEHHNKKAGWWLLSVFFSAIILIAFAAASLFLHKIPYLALEEIYDMVQLAISKVLIFSVLAYLLFLSAKNFLNHKHNAIVNKHRQNALLTHRVLVEASGDEGVRDAVLLQAASCIFSPQPTGYATGHEADVSRQKSLVEILSKSAANTVQGAGK